MQLLPQPCLAAGSNNVQRVEQHWQDIEKLLLSLLEDTHTSQACCCCDLAAPAVTEGGEAPQPPSSALDEATKAKHLEGLFLFALVWSTGATCDSAGRIKFDKFFRYIAQSPLVIGWWCWNCYPVH